MRKRKLRRLSTRPPVGASECLSSLEGTGATTATYSRKRSTARKFLPRWRNRLKWCTWISARWTRTWTLRNSMMCRSTEASPQSRCWKATGSCSSARNAGSSKRRARWHPKTFWTFSTSGNRARLRIDSFEFFRLGTKPSTTSVMTADTASGRANGRGILGVEGHRAAIKMKIRAAFQEPDATVPAENAVIIAGGADFLRFGEAAHGFFDERQKNVRGIADNELRLGAALVEQAGVVEALVGIAQTLKNG